MGASSIGGGGTPSSTTQFFGATPTVTVTSPSQRVLVVANATFGATGSTAAALNLFICYRQPSGPLTPVGNGLLGHQLPPGAKAPMGLSKVLQPSPGEYQVGLCGTGGANWSPGRVGRHERACVQPGIAA
jgi:hypothetical protein